MHVYPHHAHQNILDTRACVHAHSQLRSWPGHVPCMHGRQVKASALAVGFKIYMCQSNQESWVTVPAWNTNASVRATFIYSPLLPLPCLNKRGIRAMRSCYACKVRTHVKINKGSEMMEASEFWYGMGWQHCCVCVGSLCVHLLHFTRSWHAAHLTWRRHRQAAGELHAWK